MVDQRALRQQRLKNEYRELMSINSGLIRIEPLGEEPYEKYRIIFNLRTVVSPIPAFRDKTTCILTVPDGYPDIAPKIAVEGSSMPPPWHPNWYKSGTWCFGFWSREESLVNFIYRCAKTIQFDEAFTDARAQAAANKEAVVFWNANRGKKGIIPSDQKRLPTMSVVDTPTISIVSTKKLKIKIIH